MDADGQSHVRVSIGEMRDTLTRLQEGLEKIEGGAHPRAAVIITQNLKVIDALCVRYGRYTTMRELIDRFHDEAHDEFVKESMN